MKWPKTMRRLRSAECRRGTLRQRRAAAIWLALALSGAAGFGAAGNPGGFSVSQGNVNAVQNGPRLDITASHNAVIDWPQFNIAAGETTAFHQPSRVSVVWNRIVDASPSQILGRLEANGIVVLMNQNGFFFGPNSVVNVGGFVATTAPILPMPSGGGGLWQYQGPPPAASIINYGEIKAASGGSLFLVAEKIVNHGILSAPDGTLGLYAGKDVLLSERPDGRGLSVSVRLPEGSIDNHGQIIADAGTVALHAQVVNQNGLLRADSVQSRHGVIELIASDTIQLGPQSFISANGDTTGGASSGGKIQIKSAGAFADDPASRIEVRGGTLGGNGGAVEISAVEMPEVASQLSGLAAAGWRNGSLFFDPYDITLSASGSTTPSGTVPWDSPPTAGALRLNVNKAFKNFSQIQLQASHDITLDRNLVWNLNTSTSVDDSGCLLRLEAGNNIVFNDGARIVSSGGWSVSLAAGVDFSSVALDLKPGLGGIYLNGGPANSLGVKPALSGAIETADGNITLRAGREILVGSGYVRTVNGGNISLKTIGSLDSTTGEILTGDVDSGTKKDTYDFSRTGYDISSRGLGGIGTANGGNVTIDAGRDILSPVATIGAFFGGNVNLTAKRDIKGRFMIESGAGTLHAARDIGSDGSPASFGLVTGGWSVTAARDLYVNEVFNPNGSLNPNRMIFEPRVPFQFDYALDAYARFTAGGAVVLSGKDPAHTTDNRDRLPIYPPQLEVSAGAGGITLGNDLILYPSPLGSLYLHTTGGGPLQSSADGYFQIVASDSGDPNYKTFATGHAAAPIHLGQSSHAVRLDIDGYVQNLLLRSACAAEILIGGGTLNFSFDGQNLSANDVTRVVMGGDVKNRDDRTEVTLADIPNLLILIDPLVSMNPNLGNRLTYDAATGKLLLQGKLSEADRDFLLNPQVKVIDPLTNAPKEDENGNPILQNAVFTTDIGAIAQLFKDSQNIPTSPLAQNGLQIAGPGSFEFGARNLDLGLTAGIRSVGPLVNSALAAVSTRGADIAVDLGGDLKMTSSQIASFNGGSLAIAALGKMDIGSQGGSTSDDTPKGIYTAHGGDVSVHAAGDVLVSGSRIASYDGGDVTVISDQGRVDAGSGAKGFFYVTTSQYNPDTGELENRNDRFFGSGIMAFTRNDSDSRVGDIQVKAGGDIAANAGGIIQLAFNARDQAGSGVSLDSGGDIIADRSGVLGGDVSLRAKGNIQGLVIANRNVVIDAQKNVSVTAVAAGTASVSAGEKVSGTIAGGANVSVAGTEVSASVISSGGQAGVTGESSGSKVGAFNSVAAPVAQKATQDADRTIAANTAEKASDEEDRKRRLGSAAPTLVRRVGRVTVILPKS